MQMSTTTHIYHDTRREKKNGKYPVKLRVTYNRQQRYYPYPAAYDLSEVEFESIMYPKKGEPGKPKKLTYTNTNGDIVAFSDTHEELVEVRKTANEIIKSLGSKFSFTLFENRFLTPKSTSKDLFKLLKVRAEKLRLEEQISTAVLTECTLNSFQLFHEKKDLQLDEIDVPFLNKYEKWMIHKDNSKTTIGMYVRTIRTIFNDAIGDGKIPVELYPFASKKNKKGYKIPTGRNVKKALPISEVAAIYKYKPENENEARAKDLWLMTYLCNGANMKDLALLKFKDIDGDMIRFERAKTIRSNIGEPVLISFALTQDIKRIINKWGNKEVSPNTYIFPILNNKSSAEDQYKLVSYAVKNTNKHIKAIGKKLGIKTTITTYVARHSFSTIIRNSGKSIEFISEALGHSNIKTTQNYLAGFEDGAKKEVAGMLTDFKQRKKK